MNRGDGKQFNLTIDVDRVAEGDDFDVAIERLRDYHVAPAVDPFMRLRVIITLPAEHLRQAISTGTAVVSAAFPKWPIVAVEAMSTREFDRRVDIDDVPDLVGVTDAAALLGVSRQRVLQMVNEGKLPHARAGKAVVIPRSALKAGR